MLTDDFLSAGPAIEERLRHQAPELRHVLSAADLEGVQEKQQRTPAAHILYGSHSVTEAQPQTARARFQQTWIVVIVERNVRQNDQAAAQRAAVGPHLTAALRALMGWRPTPEHSPLAPADSPFQTAYSGGHVYVPLAFTTTVNLAGVQ